MILSIDQSTAGTKALLWGLNGELLDREDLPHRQITTPQGWVEHDPEEIIDNVKTLINKISENKEISAIGISNQRETVVCWDRKTGKPIHNAVVWQCARGADICERLKDKADFIKDRTGLPLSPYFSAAKIAWLLQNIGDKDICAGTIDSWLIYNLTGEFKTDYSNASRTQLLNLDTLTWDEEICALFGIDTGILPEICHSDSLFGYTAGNIPIHGVMGDSHAALYANKCHEKYTGKITYGTGSSIMVNVGDERPQPLDGIATSLAWGINGKVQYVLEGNINYTGAVIKWLVEDVKLLDKSSNAGIYAESVSDTGGVYLIPAFSGLGAPYFDDKARAAIVGMNRSTKHEHIIRAAEECIAYQIKDVVDEIRKIAPLTVIRADGGPAKDSFLMRFQADILGLPVEISQTEELSGAGAAYCAALGAKITDYDTVFSSHKVKKVMPRTISDCYYAGWKNAVKLIRGGKST
ncbi:MAG: FGGY family carbohydrate kinase [Oscillospiraceae bacterium]|nr:FGGY family carbohydrate kinase [Oscillospiraceae bacterium]